MLSSQDIDVLRRALLDADYTLDAVLERIGAAGRAGLARNATIPALHALGAAEDAQGVLIRLFPLQQALPRAVVDAATGGPLDVAALLRAGILREGAPGSATTAGAGVDGASLVEAAVDIRPYGFEDATGQWSGWVVAAPVPGLDTMVTPTRPDYVLGVSPASTSLAQLSVPDEVGSALDLGTGCGVQSLHLARHAGRVVATDLNPRACELAGLTMALNGLDRVEVRAGSLYEPVAAERFDLIVTNPPYVMSPPSSDGERLVYREGSFTGDGLVERIVRGAPGHLTAGGLLQVLANWADIRGTDWRDRLSEWVAGTGCDLWVVEREHLDVYEYVEMWLTDAGLAGSRQWVPRYREWLGYFEQLGVTGVGMGWIMLRNSGSARPRLRLEQWPYEIGQPVGPALSSGWRALGARAVSDDELFAAHCVLSPDVVQETMGVPGAAEPSHVVLRQGTGLRRAIEVDAALGGVLGACDGELSLGRIVDAVAGLLDAEPGRLRSELAPGLRDALADGFITVTAQG
ncbi:methyltransferase [Propionibacterium australiense]|uniref:Methyltransferase domain-containing protein n=1 Tax=Propionibacterium australiense TaxID=119981 RepID=A0A8B3FQ69_9ACTN|nr:methyltransferase [Propionibacterium australiense]RLP10167.1 methyltransferase domain-containing protein [Propionibacterium australiense]